MQAIAGTNQTQPASVASTGIACDFSALASGTNPSGGAQALLVGTQHTGGQTSSIAAFDLTVTPAVFSGTTLVQTDVGGQKILGPDGCVYLSGSGAVYKLTNADGSCPLSGLAPNPSIVLTPENTPATAAQGTTQLFDVRFPHSSLPAGTPVTYSVTGANTLQHVAFVGFGNDAIVGYAGVDAGVDRLVAYATIGGNIVASNPVAVTWTAGKHTTALSLNDAPSAANRGSTVALTATLLDLSITPPAPVVGANLTFTLTGQSCSGVTDANGTAACGLVAENTSKCALSVDYAGDATHLAANQTQNVLVSTYDIVFANGFESAGGGCIP
jgi:hypothetical protein